MIKKILVLSLFALFATACGNSSQTAQQPNQQNNVNVAIKTEDNSLTVSSHSQDQTQTKTVPANKQTENPTALTGAKPENASPMARSVDVTKMTEEIEKAKTAYEKNAKSDEAKKVLAKAYFERAFALTDAAQYRAALGDFRKGLKLDPNDEPSKKMYDEILRIFESIGREPPKEGEEPPAMPIK